MDPAEDSSTAEVESLRWLYAELIRVEQHWTDQVQNQQQRISTLLTVTGILLGFLAGAGFLTGTLSQPVRHWPANVYVASLISLCLALFMGIRALRPEIPIAGTSLNAPRNTGLTRRLFATAKTLLRSFLPVHRLSLRPPPRPFWLDAEAIRRKAGSAWEPALLMMLCDSAAENQKVADHRGTLLARRIYMYRQFTFLLLSLALLVAALVGFLVSGGIHSGGAG